MVNVRIFANYIKSLHDRLEGVSDYVVLTTEEQLKKTLDGRNNFPLLVGVIPSATPNAEDEDNIKEINTALIFVLTKPDHSSLTDDSVIDYYEETQESLRFIKNLMREDMSDYDSGCSLMQRLDPRSLQTNPEHNLFGCLGWSLSFEFETLGS